MRKTLLIFILTATLVLHAAMPAVVLKASPTFQFAPGYVRLTLIIEPDARNRFYCVSYEGTYSGQTCRQLEGAEAARTRWIDLKDLPAGEYVGQASVGRNDGSVVNSALVKWGVLESVPQGQ